MFLRLLTSLMLAPLLTMASAKAQSYTYSDGSANLYRITPGELRYIPVTKETSSSGIYSGGVARRATLTGVEFQALSRILDDAIADTRAHTDKRLMLSGAVSRDFGASKVEVLLSPGAPIKARLESHLAELLKRVGATPHQ